MLALISAYEFSVTTLTSYEIIIHVLSRHGKTTRTVSLGVNRPNVAHKVIYLVYV